MQKDLRHRNGEAWQRRLPRNFPGRHLLMSARPPSTPHAPSSTPHPSCCSCVGSLVLHDFRNRLLVLSIRIVECVEQRLQKGTAAARSLSRRCGPGRGDGSCFCAAPATPVGGRRSRGTRRLLRSAARQMLAQDKKLIRVRCFSPSKIPWLLDVSPCRARREQRADCPS